MKRVMHLVIGLSNGGAETMLYNLLLFQQDSEIVHSIVSFGKNNQFWENEIRKLGIGLIVLDLKRRPIQSLYNAYRQIKYCDVLNCWLYHCNFIGYYLGRLAKVPRILWNVRHSNLDKKYNKKFTLFINRMCVYMSSKVDRVLYNGQKAQHVHEAIGYDSRKSLIMDNGCDITRFYFKENGRNNICSELKICDRKIILSVTKDHPIKDLPTFLNAFRIMHDDDSSIVAIICGTDIIPANSRVTALIKNIGLTVGENIFLLGMRNDIPELMSACDVFILHSAGEAFPNTLIQAMACETVALSTDVGDASTILDSEEWIIPPRQPEKMAKKAIELLRLKVEEKERIRKHNRYRILQHYDIHEIVKLYEAEFER